MSSSPHSTITSSAFDMENAFSTMNIYNYTSASSGSTSFNSSEDSRDDLIPPTSSLFYNKPYLKDVQAFYAKESPIPPPDPITLPVILTPSPVLPPSLLFDPRYFFVPEELLPPKKQIHSPSSSSTTLSNSSQNSIKEHLKHHEKQIEDILYYLEELSFHRIEKMEERLVNGWIIIPRDFDEVKPKRKEARTHILELHRTERQDCFCSL
ncbi:hypothetical protein Tco_1222899 [Tanacetum coccineum]